MLEDLKPPQPQQRTCKVGQVAASLSDTDKDILLNAVMDKDNWPVKTLSRALGERGIQISDSPIYNHRNKSCSCFRG